MLSIDSYERLPKYLKSCDHGIIRLGIQNSTKFVPYRPTKGIRDLYLFNDTLFSEINKVVDRDHGVIAKLLQKIDRLDERAGLSIFSHLFQFRDIFNGRDYKILPLSYKTNRTFKFIIEHGLEPVEFSNGQIEVDSLLLLISKDGRYRL